MNYLRIQIDFTVNDGEISKEAWSELLAEVNELVSARMRHIVGDYTIISLFSDPWEEK